MRIFTKMYNILGLLEQAVATDDISKRAELYEEAKQVGVHDLYRTPEAGLFEAVFGVRPDNVELTQLCATYSKLTGRNSILHSSRRIYYMELGEKEMVRLIPFGKTNFFKDVFGEGELSQEKVDAFKVEIGRAELALCKIGADFYQTYRDNESRLAFWDHIITDGDKTMLRSLYLSNGALRQLGEHRIGSRGFSYLAHDFQYLTEKQLSRIKVRSGEIDPALVIHHLYGEQEFSPSTASLIVEAVQSVCNSQNHNCWSELLHLEFGQKETTADKILGGTIIEYPLDALQKKMRTALHYVNDTFLWLRNHTKREQNQEPSMARPYAQ